MTFLRMIKLYKLDKRDTYAKVFWRDVKGKLHQLNLCGEDFYSDSAKSLHTKKVNDRWTSWSISKDTWDIFLEDDKQ